MVVEVDDEYAPVCFVNEDPRRNAGVVEDAEAHSANGLGVMARWPHESKDRRMLRDRTLHCDDRSACRAARYSQRGRIDDGVARREVARPIADAFDVALDTIDIRLRMRKNQLVVPRIARS